MDDNGACCASEMSFVVADVAAAGDAGGDVHRAGVIAVVVALEAARR